MKKSNIIDQGFSVFEKVQRQQDSTVDEVSFVGGFMTCFGILTGRIPIEGLRQDIPIAQIFDRIQGELEDYRRKVIIRHQEELAKGG